jgi:Rps23 Pro-64 3,4-dihydroxylase Tpa1-like proline 4-hydroxylase
LRLRTNHFAIGDDAMRFIWHSIDIENYLDQKLGGDWDSRIINYALEHIRMFNLTPNNVTSRESIKSSMRVAAPVNGNSIKTDLPFLDDLYRQEFLDLARAATNLNVVIAKEQIYAINLNIQVGKKMHYECHVDSNPIQGMLYVTTHKPEEGGELVVANHLNAKSISDVDKDCIRIYPKRGLLVFFDARKHAHYVPPLRSANATRVAVAMNFYTPESPEDSRPPDLSKHLGLVQGASI